ncbi:MAG TPA: AAA family ATPase [Spirochaetota bacterium]|nr:AAA family ATPase [Spirochaetota bacterium]
MDTQGQPQIQSVQEHGAGVLICPACKTKNRAIAKYCKECGEIIRRAEAAEPLSSSDSQEPAGIAGLENVRMSINEIVNRVKIINERKSRGMTVSPLYLHSVFKGDTGTGKTMIGSYFASEFRKIGALSKGTILEIDNETLKREGQNLQAAVVKWIEKARGGILFFDEMHKSTESISNIVKGMTTAGDDIIIIMAGMKEPLDKYFEENREDKQRIGHIFDFNNYSEDELLQIALMKLQSYQFRVADEAMEPLRDYIRVTMYSGKSEYKNGWLIERDIIPKILNRQSNRLTNSGNYSDDDLVQITAADIPDEGVQRKTPDEILAAMDDLVGMESVKNEIRKLAHSVNIRKEQQKSGIEGTDFGVHMVFTGNPGTGKTTVARIVGELLKAIGLLPSGHVVDTDRRGLVGQYIGETAQKTAAVIDSAMGGVLLIDEAYSLVPEEGGKDYGQEAIDTLLKSMEDNRGKFVVIAAGYKDEMERFISSNPGLKSRFTNFFHLEDYKPEELYKIFSIMVKKSGFVLSGDAEAKAQDVLKEIYNKRDKKFANGRTVRNLFEGAIKEQASRLTGMSLEERTPDKLNIITAEDIPYTLQERLSVDDILSQLDSMVGMDNIKKDVRELILFANTQMKREEIEGRKSSIVPHIVLTGNPGTGKTTVARMIGKLFNSIGMLPSDHFIEVDKSGLVAQYVGQTSPKVNGVVDRAIGGVLFIDEAYTLTNDGQGGGFSQEAIDTLMKRMEDDRGKFVVIAAGYKKDMERFLKSNSGLPSRFTRKFHFEDYKASELEQIFMIIASSQGYKLAEEAKPVLSAACRNMYENRDENFGNGRDIRNLFDNILLNQSVRLSKMGDVADNSLYSVIEAEDFPVEEEKEDSLEAALARLDKLTGLASVKKEVRELINFIKIEKLRNDGEGSSKIGGHYVFTGNPGTGKTTVARILSEIFKNMGILSKGHLVEKDRGGLVGQYIGETAQKTAAAIDEAMGGVLFVDEAYALIPEDGGKDFGKEAVDTLLKRMEDDKGKFIVIAAGYKNEMNRFVNSNPGLPSRFQNTIEFEDYTPEELISIFKGMAASKKMIMTPEFESKLTSVLTGIYDNRDNNFANGRTVRNLFESTQKRQSNRVAGLSSLNPGDPVLFTFEAEDLV